MRGATSSFLLLLVMASNLLAMVSRWGVMMMVVGLPNVGKSTIISGLKNIAFSTARHQGKTSTASQIKRTNHASQANVQSWLSILRSFRPKQTYLSIVFFMQKQHKRLKCLTFVAGCSYFFRPLNLCSVLILKVARSVFFYFFRPWAVFFCLCSLGKADLARSNSLFLAI